MSESSQAVKVVVRIRPPTQLDKEEFENKGRAYTSTLQVTGTQELEASLPKLNILSPSFAKGSDTAFKCRFSRVLRPAASQNDVFGFFRDDISAVLNGANVTIFAYGQTGTGKTHTMVGAWSGNASQRRRSALRSFARLGNKNDWGIIPRALNLLFDSARNPADNESKPNSDRSTLGDDQKSCEDRLSSPVFLMSYLQIYNERVYDLLAPFPSKDSRNEVKQNIHTTKALPLRMTLNEGAFVDGLSKHELNSLETALQLFDFGESRRKIRATQSNMASSRSHVVLQVRVLSINQGSGGGSFSSILTLVDLAGSEKWKKSMLMDQRSGNQFKQGRSKSSAAHLREMNSINSSLSALGKCIRALSQKGNNHVPYRDSTLTKLLKHAFNPPNSGRGCHTSIIATVSSSRRSFHETINTLRFADRASQVMVKAGKARRGVQNGGGAKAVLRIAKDEIRRLRQELAETRLENASLRQLVSSGSHLPASDNTSPQTSRTSFQAVHTAVGSLQPGLRILDAKGRSELQPALESDEMTNVLETSAKNKPSVPTTTSSPLEKYQHSKMSPSACGKLNEQSTTEAGRPSRICKTGIPKLSGKPKRPNRRPKRRHKKKQSKNKGLEEKTAFRSLQLDVKRQKSPPHRLQPVEVLHEESHIRKETLSNLHRPLHSARSMTNGRKKLQPLSLSPSKPRSAQSLTRRLVISYDNQSTVLDSNTLTELGSTASQISPGRPVRLGLADSLRRKTAFGAKKSSHKSRAGKRKKLRKVHLDTRPRMQRQSWTGPSSTAKAILTYSKDRRKDTKVRSRGSRNNRHGNNTCNEQIVQALDQDNNGTTSDDVYDNQHDNTGEGNAKSESNAFSNDILAGANPTADFMLALEAEIARVCN